MTDDDPPYFTWRHLRDRINAMPEDRLDDPVQFIPPPPNDEPIALGSVIAMDSIRYYSAGVEDGSLIENYTRGIIDNKNHPDHHVLLTDSNPFSKDGDSYYTMTDEGFIGNKSGKNVGPNWLKEED